RAAPTRRSRRRAVISRAYNLMIKLLFWRKGFSDAQCGFKGATRKAVRNLVPLIKDQAWFFDSELLLLAERKGYRIAEIPVEWIEDLDTPLRIVRTAREDI